MFWNISFHQKGRYFYCLSCFFEWISFKICSLECIPFGNCCTLLRQRWQSIRMLRDVNFFLGESWWKKTKKSGKMLLMNWRTFQQKNLFKTDSIFLWKSKRCSKFFIGLLFQKVFLLCCNAENIKITFLTKTKLENSRTERKTHPFFPSFFFVCSK